MNLNLNALSSASAYEHGLVCNVTLLFFLTLEGEQWICKPTGLNQGKGIFLVHSLEQLREKLQKDQEHCRISTRPVARVVQRWAHLLATYLQLWGVGVGGWCYIACIPTPPLLWAVWSCSLSHDTGTFPSRYYWRDASSTSEVFWYCLLLRRTGFWPFIGRDTCGSHAYLTTCTAQTWQSIWPISTSKKSTLPTRTSRTRR